VPADIAVQEVGGERTTVRTSSRRRLDACRHAGGDQSGGRRNPPQHVDRTRRIPRTTSAARVCSQHMPASRANVFTIPASAPFLTVLIDALCAGKLVRGFPDLSDPLGLSRATLYLPTRRACRLAREVFLDALGRDAAILPRIVPLGDIDEDELVFGESAGQEALALPDALDPLERRLTLAQLIARWTQSIAPEKGAPLIANTPAAALGLADDLGRLM